jgi:hypothetical protein
MRRKALLETSPKEQRHVSRKLMKDLVRNFFRSTRRSSIASQPVLN